MFCMKHFALLNKSCVVPINSPCVRVRLRVSVAHIVIHPTPQKHTRTLPTPHLTELTSDFVSISPFDKEPVRGQDPGIHPQMVAQRQAEEAGGGTQRHAARPRLNEPPLLHDALLRSARLPPCLSQAAATEGPK